MKNLEQIIARIDSRKLDGSTRLLHPISSTAALINGRPNREIVGVVAKALEKLWEEYEYD